MKTGHHTAEQMINSSTRRRRGSRRSRRCVAHMGSPKQRSTAGAWPMAGCPSQRRSGSRNESKKMRASSASWPSGCLSSTCSKRCWEKGLSVADQRTAVQVLVAGGLSVQRAGALLQLHRSTFRYAAHPRDDGRLLDEGQTLAARYPRYGYRRIHALVRRGTVVNQKRSRRVWRRHRLPVPRVRRLRLRRVRPTPLRAADPGHIWAYDFLEVALADGTPLRIVTVLDEFTRAGLALDVALTSSADQVSGVLTALFGTVVGGGLAIPVAQLLAGRAFGAGEEIGQDGGDGGQATTVGQNEPQAPQGQHGDLGPNKVGEIS